jgi:hypothetical protein
VIWAAPSLEAAIELLTGFAVVSGAAKHTETKPAYHLIDGAFRHEVLHDLIYGVKDVRCALRMWHDDGESMFLRRAASGIANMYGTENPRGTAELELARVLRYGADKYDRGSINFRKGHKWSDMWRAAHGHVESHLRGDLIDPQSGLMHLSHALGQVMMLWVHQKNQFGTDDRNEVWT